MRFLAVAVSFLLPTIVDAQLLTGTITDYPESNGFNRKSFGDGANSVLLYWSVNIVDRSGYFYRDAIPGPSYQFTEVAFAAGVSSLEEITDASIYDFTVAGGSYFVGPVFDVEHTGGEGSFIVLRNPDNYYGVVRIDDIFHHEETLVYGDYEYLSHSRLNATWWFQADGSANFSPIPEPATLYLLGLGSLALVMLRRRR